MNNKVKKSAGSVILVCIVMLCFAFNISAQSNLDTSQYLSGQEQRIVAIAALAAKGDLPALKGSLNRGLELGLTISEIKEVLVHLYAYAGFPRSIRGLQTFMEVLKQRRTRGIHDREGKNASPIAATDSKYDRGKKILSRLTQTAPPDTLSGYSAFAPTIDSFLKEHLFADIFERDVLTYGQRELVTVSVLSTIGGVEPMLRAHFAICLNVGLKPAGLQQFVQIIKRVVGEQEGSAAQTELNEVLNKKNELKSIAK